MKIGAALVTGSAKRIGREMAFLLALKGYDIAIHYNNSKKEAQLLADEIRQKFKVNAEIFQANLNDANEAKKLAILVEEKFPDWNLLINNASIFNHSQFLEQSENELYDNLNVHFLSPLILSKVFAKHVLAKKNNNAQIINMVDKNIARFDTKYFYYLLSKKILAEFTQMLALELAPSIRVNAIAPGFILDCVHDKEPSDESKKLPNRIPLKTKGDVKNILQTIEFLLENNFVTGQVLFIDGGASLNHAG